MSPLVLNSLIRHQADAVAFGLLLAALGLLFLRHLRRHHLSRWWNVATWAITAGSTVVGIWCANRAGDAEQQRLRTMLEGFAPTYASAFEALGYASIGLDTAADDPLYLRLIEQQKAWLQVNRSAHDIYTFHRDDAGQIVLVVDSETDYDRDGVFDGDREARTEIGEVYEADGEQLADLERVFGGENVFVEQPTVDRWGIWVTAYSPLHAPDGSVVAVLGVDYDCQAWLRAIAGHRLATFGYFTIWIVMLMVGGVSILLQRERALRDLAAAKNAELERANSSLREASLASQAANLAKSEFLANMSHELRTPLTAILGFADLLGDASQDPEEQQMFVETIRRSGNHLLTLLNDVLELSKFEAGVVRTELEPCEPERIAAEVVEMFLPQVEHKDLTLTLDVDASAPRRIVCDPGRLRQILVNLVGNAIKFTDIGAVQIRLCGNAASGQLLVSVEDSGPGLSAEQQALLFRPFSQVDTSVARRHGGAGLGLVISRSLARALGGELDLTSVVGQGCKFHLRLPVGDLAAFAGRDNPPEVAAKSGRVARKLTGRVLVVDDGADNRRLLTSVLKRVGLEVCAVEDGRQALDLLLGPTGDAQVGFDMILMDVQMPEVDGHTATRALRAAGLTTPILAVTAHAMQCEQQRCLDSGCDDFVTKPVDRASLLDKVEHLLGPRRDDPADS